MSTRVVHWGHALLLASGLVGGCGGEDGGPSGPMNAGGAGGTGDPPGGACTEGSALFTPVVMGIEGNEPIGRIVAAEDGTLYMSSGTELWTWRPAASNTATREAERPVDVWGTFWLAEDRWLLPSGFQIPIVEDEVAVLFSKRLSAGGDIVVEVAAPVSNPDWDYDVGSVTLRGDDVYWIGHDMEVDSLGLAVEGGTTHYVRRTSWRDPGTPEVLYQSSACLSGLRTTGSLLFVDEAMDDPDTPAADEVQYVFDLDVGSASREPTRNGYLGNVMAIGANSVLVMRSDADLLGGYEHVGTYFMRLDDGYEEKLPRVYLIGLGPPMAASNGDDWLVTALDSETPSVMEILLYEQGQGLRRLGCMNADDSTFALALTAEQALVGHFDGERNTVLAFDR